MEKFFIQVTQMLTPIIISNRLAFPNNQMWLRKMKPLEALKCDLKLQRASRFMERIGYSQHQSGCSQIGRIGKSS
jgi:hypothetical protein